MLSPGRMPIGLRLPGGVRGALLAWGLAEVLAFVVVVHLVGFGGAVLLGLGTTLLGIVMLRRIGLEAAGNLRRAMAGRTAQDGGVMDGMLAALGAMLLILPGFVANFVGCALAAPSVRGWASRRLGIAATPGARPVPRRTPTDVIDLGPDDWRPVDR